MTGLPDPVADPAGYVLAVADLREQRANAVPRGPWRVEGDVYDRGEEDIMLVHDDVGEHDSDIVARFVETREAAEHIAAEANPAHALAEVALWRGVAERHVPKPERPMFPQDEFNPICAHCGEDWRCPDLLAVVAACQAYAGWTT